MDKIKCGTIREDGKVFWRYCKRKNGMIEYWVSPEIWAKMKSNNAAYEGTRRVRAYPREKRNTSTRGMTSQERKAHNREVKRRWILSNPDKMKQQYEKQKAKRALFKPSDLRRLAQAARVRIRQFLKEKKGSSIVHLGCSFEHLKAHLETQFSEGMSWDNYGLYGWHVDHRIPLSAANTLEELFPLFHFTNLQPLWAFDNLSKGSKVL